MNTLTGALPPGHTAKILTFPLRDRVSTLATPEQKFAAMEAKARRLASVAASSGWYHEAALDAPVDAQGVDRH